MRKNINLLYYWDAEGYKSWQKIFSEKAPEIKVFNKDKINEEYGDILFTLINYSRFISEMLTNHFHILKKPF